MILLDAVRAEGNIRLFLNTVVTDVEMAGPRKVRLVRGYQAGERTGASIWSPRFVDATGDGVIAYKAGAEYRVSGEGRDVYNEMMAPLLGTQRRWVPP